MKVIEQYYGPVRNAFPFTERVTATEIAFYAMKKECYIHVRVGGKGLHLKQFFHQQVPAKEALYECHRLIMREVQREVFGS